MKIPRLARAAAAALSLVLAHAPAARAQSTDPLFELVTQAQEPIYVADPGDGRLFIVERDGYIRIFSGGQLQTRQDAFLDIDALVQSNSGGEDGLLSLAFDPDFATNRHVYVMYTRDSTTTNVVLESVVARYTAMAGDPTHADTGSAKLLMTLDAPPGPQFNNHKGGQLQFGPDGMLYVGFGDGGSSNDPDCRAQTRDVFFGKMLRIDPHGTGRGVGGIGYGLPSNPSNPFASDPNYLPEIWALGLRNPWRFSFDRETGELWIGDVGQNAREEIDLQDANSSGGQNYGWDAEEGDIDGPGGGCPAYVSSAIFTDPIFAYSHSVGHSITGGYVYRGSAAPEWRGRYLYADFIFRRIFSLARNGATWNSTLLFADDDASRSNWSSFGEGSDGELYVADLSEGWVYKLRLDRVSSGDGNTVCVAKLNEGFAKLANTSAKVTASCVATAAKGKLGGTDLETCSASNAKLSKVGDKNAATEAKHCGEAPAFGYTSAATGNAAATESESDLVHDVFGADLDSAIVPKADDKDAAACQKAVLAGLHSCQKARRAEFVRCKKVGLKKRTIVDGEELSACLDSDPKGKLAKLCDATTGKLATKTIEKSCSARGVDLSDAFPGCATDDPDVLAQCLAEAGCERSCEMFDAADGLDVDCGEICLE